MPIPTARSAVFLDRDGVINVDHGYVHRVDQFQFVPGIFELTRFVVHELGWPVIVATNQSGIGRGYFDEASYRALTDWMCERFRVEHAPLTRVYHCPFHPEFGIGAYKVDHAWRKPKPGMFLQAAADFTLDLPQCVAIGDSLSDMEAAAAAGIRRRLRLVSGGSRNSPSRDRQTKLEHQPVPSLAEALTLLRTG
jgi:D-glycero-D-manno-heptose 1,7-bisphosphate phosphatase